MGTRRLRETMSEAEILLYETIDELLLLPHTFTTPPKPEAFQMTFAT